MNEFLTAAFPFARNSRLELVVILLVGVFVALFLIVFQPFGTLNYESEIKNLFLSGYGVIVSTVLIFFRFAVPAFMRSQFDEDEWTVGKHILWCFLAFAAAISACFLYWSWYFEHQLSLLLWWEFSRLGVSVAFFPILGIIALDYISLLKAHQRRAASIDVAAVIPAPKNVAEPLWKICGNNEGEEMLLRPEQLLYMRAERNYVDVFYDNRDNQEETNSVVLQQAVFRASLRELEAQLSAPELVRCHRSYLVNLARVRAITGNAQGYQLQLPPAKNDVPVSRSRAKHVLELLHRKLG